MSAFWYRCSSLKFELSVRLVAQVWQADFTAKLGCPMSPGFGDMGYHHRTRGMPVSPQTMGAPSFHSFIVKGWEATNPDLALPPLTSPQNWVPHPRDAFVFVARVGYYNPIKPWVGRETGRLAMVEFRSLCDWCNGRRGDRVRMDRAETGSEPDAGERTVVQPTLRKEREGWGTHRDGLGKKVKARRVGHPPVLVWADSAQDRARLTTVDAICEAHDSLMVQCATAYGRKRDFTSLASKALWLCYRNDVPIFDSYSNRALSVLSKLERSITTPDERASQYRQFACVWNSFYERFQAIMDGIDTQGYPYPVRVFDVTLWMIGAPGYVIPQSW